jgi:thiol-disulfide isomerase/thioredoxin
MMSFIKSCKAYLTGWRKLLLEVLIIAIVFFGVRYYQHQGVLKGAALPIEGILLDKTPLDWSKYQGKPLLIHFWATWCSICKFEENSIQSISKDYNVITIAAWSDDTLAYMQKQGLSFSVLEDADGVWATKYGVKAVPTSFIINQKGDIDFIESGYSSELGLRLRLWWLK